jgi:enoyl-CoA hydratase/carnithine racemase
MVSGAGFETLRVQRQRVIGWLLFNRAATRNAVNVQTHDELPRGWSTLEPDPEVRAIVCSGARPHFSGGVDLVDLADARRSRVFRRNVERPESARFTASDELA